MRAVWVDEDTCYLKSMPVTPQEVPLNRPFDSGKRFTGWMKSTPRAVDEDLALGTVGVHGPTERLRLSIRLALGLRGLQEQRTSFV